MSLNIEQLDHLARLARLALTAEEKEKFSEDFSGILGYFSQLEKLNTANIMPAGQVINLENIYRPDDVQDCPAVIQAKILANAPDKLGRQIKVKKIL
jgi:aspartyl-tRNA(Asn)/glutamyl-tRNA(Gln) amidotransferase subunit C